MSKHTPGPMKKRKWNREAFYRLLRFGRKNDGGWTDAEIFWNEETQAYDKGYVPDDNDIDLLMAAPDLLEAVEMLLIGAAACAIPHPKEREALQMAVDFAINAKRKAKGESNG